MTLSARPKSTGPDAETVELVWNRDGGRCVKCGQPLPWSERGYRWSVQHRKPRGQGGDNSPSNLILLCGSGTTGCHGWVENQGRGESYDAGWLVRMLFDPRQTSVLVDHGSRRTYLDDLGNYTDDLSDPPLLDGDPA